MIEHMIEQKYVIPNEEMKECERELRTLLGIQPWEGDSSGLYRNGDENHDEDDEPDFYGELKQCAWNVLHENPGIDCGDWMNILIEQYPTEVVDALGSNPSEAFPALEDMWGSNDYEDPETGECHSFRDWAEYFATERSVELYDMLAEERAKISRFKTLLKQIQGNIHQEGLNALTELLNARF